MSRAICLEIQIAHVVVDLIEVEYFLLFIINHYHVWERGISHVIHYNKVWRSGTLLMLISIYIIQFLHAGRISLTPPRARHWTLRKLLWIKLVTLMSAYSGRNYNFRCINVVFWHVFARVSAYSSKKPNYPLAQIREKLPNAWEYIHMGIDVHKQITPRDTWGHLVFLRGQQFKSLGKLSDWHQLWFTSADSSGNGHRLKTIDPTIPHGGILGGFRG